MNAPRVAVVGGGLGGMSAAGLLAAAGARVTLFEAAPTLGGKACAVRAGSVRLDAGPTLLTFPHVVRELFDALHARELMPRLLELETHCAYRWEDGRRFHARRDLAATLAEAEALRPGEGAALERFYAACAEVYRFAGEPYLDAPYEGLPRFFAQVARAGPGAIWRGASLATLDAFAARFLQTSHLRQFAGRFATYAGADPRRASAAFAMIAHVERAFGVHHPEGGISALVAALERAIRRLGVRVQCGLRASWARERGAWRVGSDADREAFDALVLNADPLAVRGQTRGPLALSGYVLLLRAPRRLELPHHAILFARDTRAEFDALFSGAVPAEPTVYVCHPAASDPSVVGPAESGVYLMVNAPPLRDSGDERARWGEERARLRELCVSALRRHFPAVRDEPLERLGERTPMDLAELGAPRGSIYGFLPHGRFGPFGRPRMRGAQGEFFVGGGTHPGGGVPLVMRSGRFAAEAVARELGLRTEPARAEALAS